MASRKKPVQEQAINGIVGIGLAGQKAFQLPFFCFCVYQTQCCQAFFNGGLIPFGLAKLNQCAGILKLLLQPFEAGQGLFQTSPFLHDVLGVGRFVPQGRIFGQGVQFIQPKVCSIPVKDASSAGPSPA